jgi:hydrogenase/urease accessory protein HupE
VPLAPDRRACWNWRVVVSNLAGSGTMVRVHEGVGTLVVLAFLALTIVNVLQATGRSISWSRQLSFGAAGLLLVQYVLGFGLLSGHHHITPFHYIIALCAIITVGLEHGYADAQEDPSTRARLGAAFAAGTTVLVLVAYAIGQSNK